jgi:hypothetical protein
MIRKVIVITKDWDYLRSDLELLCERLIKSNVECEMRDLDDTESRQLVIRYGIENGIVRIPQIYVIKDGNIKRMHYEVTKDVRLNVDSLIINIMNEVCSRE